MPLTNLKKKRDSYDTSAKPGGQNQDANKPSGLGGSNLAQAAQSFRANGSTLDTSKPIGGIIGAVSQVADKIKNGEIGNNADKDFVKKKFGVDIEKLSERDIIGPSRFQNLKPNELGDSKIMDSFLS